MSTAPPDAASTCCTSYYRNLGGHMLLCLDREAASAASHICCCPATGELVPHPARWVAAHRTQQWRKASAPDDWQEHCISVRMTALKSSARGPAGTETMTYQANTHTRVLGHVPDKRLGIKPGHTHGMHASPNATSQAHIDWRSSAIFHQTMR